MADFDFLSENPKLIQRRMASGSIPLPSSRYKVSNFGTKSQLNTLEY